LIVADGGDEALSFLHAQETLPMRFGCSGEACGRVYTGAGNPSPSPESGKGFPPAGFLLRRNRTIRPLTMRDFCSGAYISARIYCPYAEAVQSNHHRPHSALGGLAPATFPRDCLTI
jgi:hypothetical protein